MKDSKNLQISAIAACISTALLVFPYAVFAESHYGGFIYGNGNYGDDVTITGANSGGYQGSAIYKNANNGVPGDHSTGIVIGNNLVATTGTLNALRNGADVIMTKAGSGVDASIVIGDNAKLTAKGLSGDGINIGYGSGSMTVILGENAVIDISAISGMGVRANLGDRDSIINLIELGKGAVITTAASGNNTTNGSGYGVYAGNRQKSNESGALEDTVQLGQAIVKIGEDGRITTSGANAHGVYANKGGRVILGNNTTIITNNTSASSVANGLHVEKGTEANFDGGKIELLGGVNITAKGAKSNAISAYGEGSIIHSYDAENDLATEGQFNIVGNILADQQSTVALNMVNQSVMTGNVNALNQANIDLVMKDNSTLTGDLIAKTQGKLNLALAQNSSLTGDINAFDDNSEIGLTLQSGSWIEGNATADSLATVNLALTDLSLLKGDINATNNGSMNVALGSGSQVEGNISAESLSSTVLALDESSLAGNITATSQGSVTVNASNASVIDGYTRSVIYDAATDSWDYANAGTINMSLATGSVWNMTASSSLSDISVGEGSQINFIHSDSDPTFKTLTVAGNYHGDGGLLVMNTQLGDDSSPTDKLVIAGDTTGSTYVAVNNAGGMGALTANGIKLIEVQGDSSGQFVQQGRIVAGLYDYYLQRGDSSHTSPTQYNPAQTALNDWYLISKLPPVEPPEEPEPPVVEPPEEPEPPVVEPPEEPEPPVVEPPEEPEPPVVDPEEPEPPVVDPKEPEPPVVDPKEPEPPVVPNKPKDLVVRPEAGSYIANHAAGNTLFTTRLHDRLGETQYTDVLTGEGKVTSMWLRQLGGRNNFKDSSGQLKTSTNRYVMQLGGDIAQWSTDGLDRWHLGLMAGYANAKSHTHSNKSRHDSRSSIDGYSVGAYGTWYSNDVDKTGLYVDTWLLYNWFKNSVNGDDLPSESYDSNGFTGSVESGYTFKVHESERRKVFIQPKAQLTWMGVKADRHIERNGTQIDSTGNNNVQTRLGVRAYMQGNATQDDNKDRTFEPFAEINWIHNTQRFGVEMNNVKLSQDGARNIGEVKVGIEGQFSQRTSGWINIAQQIGDAGYSDTSGMLGIKYSF